ncbi:HD domain-containing protein [Flagellimonas sp.]|uniref:HD domain-containing protein n=1 Tax=Flagellimonas sp. TaxID=2058762 RepID=UPI003B5A5FBD
MKDILGLAKKHCVQLLTQSRCSELPFHNVMHTMEVYENVLKIGMHEKLDMDELEPVLLAALFHDVGNTITFMGHEGHSAHEAFSFLTKQKYPNDKITMVCNSIYATQIPQNPRNIYENILCDADLFHLGSKQYFVKCELLRREWFNFLQLDYSDQVWSITNIQFLSRHRFHTKYGKKILEPIKQENICLLKKLIND